MQCANSMVDMGHGLIICCRWCCTFVKYATVHVCNYSAFCRCCTFIWSVTVQVVHDHRTSSVVISRHTCMGYHHMHATYYGTRFGHCRNLGAILDFWPRTEACYSRSWHYLVFEGMPMNRLAIKFSKIISCNLERDCLGGFQHGSRQPTKEEDHGWFHVKLAGLINY